MTGKLPETEDELRQWLARHLNVRDVPDDEWDELCADNYVSDALDVDYDDPEHLLQEFLERAAVIRQRRTQWRRARRSESQGPAPSRCAISLTEGEQERARLASNALAREADGMPWLVKFRSWVRNEVGHDPSREEAQQIVHQITHGSDLSPADEPFVRGLVGLATWLVERYPWGFDEAAVFVLSGVPPWVEPVRALLEVTEFNTCTTGRITLEVEPWVSAVTVERTFRALQDEMLGKDNRPIEAPTLSVLAYVGSRLSADAAPSWSEIYRGWMEGNRRQYLNEYSLKRAYESARRRLVRPIYAMFWPDGFPVQLGVPRRIHIRNRLPSLISVGQNDTGAD